MSIYKKNSMVLLKNSMLRRYIASLNLPEGAEKKTPDLMREIGSALHLNSGIMGSFYTKGYGSLFS